LVYLWRAVDATRCAGPGQQEQASGAQIDAQAFEEIWGGFWGNTVTETLFASLRVELVRHPELRLFEANSGMLN
jgi:hypothetical protein